MKKSLVIALALFSTCAMASNNYDEIVKADLARVVKVQPITNTRYYTVPRQSCTMVEEVVPAQPPVSGVPIDQNQKRVTERCITYSDREFKQDIIGFDVTFEYQSQLRTVRMNYDPGNTVRIKTVTKVFVIE